jgi:hypothetical protein
LKTALSKVNPPNLPKKKTKEVKMYKNSPNWASHAVESMAINTTKSDIYGT